jgi:GNAT superfamily N-acetyltransferase
MGSVDVQGERMGVHIREAGTGDASLLLGLIRELAEFEKLSHEVEATEENIRESLLQEHINAHAVIAEVNGRSVGFAVYFYNYSTFLGRPGLYIEDLYVHPDRRGEGIGRALFSHCARVALENRCGRLEFAVLHWNPARQFYEKMGAREMNDWIIYRLTGPALQRASHL